MNFLDIKNGDCYIKDDVSKSSVQRGVLSRD